MVRAGGKSKRIERGGTWSDQLIQQAPRKFEHTIRVGRLHRNVTKRCCICADTRTLYQVEDPSSLRLVAYACTDGQGLVCNLQSAQNAYYGSVCNQMQMHLFYGRLHVDGASSMLRRGLHVTPRKPSVRGAQPHSLSLAESFDNWKDKGSMYSVEDTD